VRAFNRVLSAFLAAIMVVAGVLAILEICRAALGQPPAVVQWPKLLPKLRNNSYDDAGPILVCVGLALVGLLILVSGLRRGKPYALPAGSSAPGVRTEIHRRSLQRAMRAAVLAVDRVDSGRVSLRRRSARILVQANTVTIDGLEADIRRRVENLMSSIALVEPLRLKIKASAASTPPAPASAQTPVGVGAAGRPTAPSRTETIPPPEPPAPEPPTPPPPPPPTSASDSATAGLDDLLWPDPEDESR
jgi:hypothetical protein